MDTGTLALSIIATTGLVGYLALFVALHFLPTGYSPVRHAVSDYAVGRYAGLFRWALVISSLGVLALAIGLTRDPGAPPLGTSDLVLLYLVPVMRIGMTLFPTDLEGQEITARGRLHYLFAIASFAFVYSAIIGMTPVLDGLSPWASVHDLLEVLRWICLGSLVLLVATLFPNLRSIFGIFERAFVVFTNVWLITVGICLAVSAAS